MQSKAKLDNDYRKFLWYLTFLYADGLYIIKDFTQIKIESDEILKSEWFPLTQLPTNISAGSRRRIEEYLWIRKIGEKW